MEECSIDDSVDDSDGSKQEQGPEELTIQVTSVSEMFIKVTSNFCWNFCLFDNLSFLLYKKIMDNGFAFAITTVFLMEFPLEKTTQKPSGLQALKQGNFWRWTRCWWGRRIVESKK